MASRNRLSIGTFADQEEMMASQSQPCGTRPSGYVVPEVEPSGAMARVSRATEAIILRRLHQARIDGYTLDMSQEIARAAVAAMSEPPICWGASNPEPVCVNHPSCERAGRCLGPAPPQDGETG